MIDHIRQFVGQAMFILGLLEVFDGVNSGFDGTEVAVGALTAIVGYLIQGWDPKNSDA